MSNIAVFGIYQTRENLESAVRQLELENFRGTDVSVLVPQNVGTKDFAHSKATKAPEGVAVGAGSGAVIGGALGWLASIGAIAIPGIGPLIAAGPIVAALAGLGAVGAIGGIAGALIGLGLPEYEAKRYEGRVRKGGILLSVHADNHEWAGKAKAILHRTGAEDVAAASEERGDFANASKPMTR